MSTVVSVASSVWNMAGDINKRDSFLKTTVLGAVIHEKDMAATITSSYLHGSGIRLRNYATWAETKGYGNLVGTNAVEYNTPAIIDDTVIKPYLPNNAVITNVVITNDIVSIYINTYLVNTYGTTNNTTVTHITGNQYKIVRNSNGIPTEETITIPYTLGIDTLVCTYRTFTGTILPDSVSNNIVLSYSDTAGYTLDTTNTNHLQYSGSKQIKVTKVYSTNSTEIVSDTLENVSISYTETSERFSKVEYVIGNPARRITTTLTQFNTTTINPAHTTTTNSNSFNDGEYYLVTEVTEPVISYELHEQTVVSTLDGYTVSPEMLFMYQYHTGESTLDSLFGSTDNSVGVLLPIIPLRYNNVSITEHSQYSKFREAYRKLMGVNQLERTVQKLNDNEHISDIDYAYIVVGVSLNTPEMAGKQYLFEFFKWLKSTNVRTTAYDSWYNNKLNNQENSNIFNNWVSGQNTPTSQYLGQPNTNLGSLLYDSPKFSLKMYSNLVEIPYEVSIVWELITETSGTGKKDANKGYGVFLSSVDTDLLLLNQTISGWSEIVVKGLINHNNVYKFKSVSITASDALADTAESAFIVPIHKDIIKKLGIVNETQLCTTCTYMLCNSYEERKLKWYEEDWFQAVLFIGSIMIGIYTGGITGSSVGVLGTNSAVGAALGFIGVQGVLLGAIANGIATIILMKVLDKVGSSLFGKEFSQLFSMIAMMAFSVSSNGWSYLTKPSNLMDITNALGSAYSDYYSTKLSQMNNTDINSSNYDNMYFDQFGYGVGLIESPSEYMQRTLMSPDTVINMYLSSVSEYTERFKNYE